MEKTTKLTVKDLAQISMMTALIAVCAWLTIPFTVPFTMQTFAVFVTLLLLEGRKGTIAILLYILLGAFGLPVFSGFRGGLGALLGPTGGYILGFLLCALLYWLLEGRPNELIPLVGGLLLCYFFGTLWFVYVYSSGGKEIGFGAALGLCVVPYLIPDAIKLLLAFVLARRVKKAVRL